MRPKQRCRNVCSYSYKCRNVCKFATVIYKLVCNLYILNYIDKYCHAYTFFHVFTLPKALSPSYMSYPRLRCSRTTLWRIMFATPGPAAVGGQWLWGDIGEPWGECHKIKSSAVIWHFGVRPHMLRLMITIVPWHQLADSSAMHCSAKCPVIPSNHISSTSES